MILIDFIVLFVACFIDYGAILVSGLWGIFYFHEVRGAETIAKWFMSALVTIFGILLLSYEHHAK